MTFISTNTRLLNTVHALYAWVSPSPRVRCLLAGVTYLLTYTETPSLPPSHFSVLFSFSLILSFSP